MGLSRNHPRVSEAAEEHLVGRCNGVDGASVLGGVDDFHAVLECADCRLHHLIEDGEGCISIRDGLVVVVGHLFGDPGEVAPQVGIARVAEPLGHPDHRCLATARFMGELNDGHAPHTFWGLEQKIHSLALSRLQNVVD